MSKLSYVLSSFYYLIFHISLNFHTITENHTGERSGCLVFFKRMVILLFPLVIKIVSALDWTVYDWLYSCFAQGARDS